MTEHRLAVQRSHTVASIMVPARPIMVRLHPAIMLVVLMTSMIQAQTTAGDASTVEPRQLIDIPTAGLLSRGAFALDADFFQNGGLGIAVSAGALDRLSFGISYSGIGIIGNSSVTMQKLPGVNIKFRLFDESMAFPAIAIGFDSQGKEAYIDSTERFTIKSRGVYAVASKNYAMLGNFSVHSGVNLSMERGDGDKDMDIFLGVEKSFGTNISLLGEYDFGFNDNGPRSLGQGKGYLNLGVRWSFGNGVTVGFDMKDVLKNQENIVTIGNRTMKVEFVKSL
jgi:Exopolysaccharide biosynthesis protein YbjH